MTDYGTVEYFKGVISRSLVTPGRELSMLSHVVLGAMEAVLSESNPEPMKDKILDHARNLMIAYEEFKKALTKDDVI